VRPRGRRRRTARPPPRGNGSSLVGDVEGNAQAIRHPPRIARRPRSERQRALAPARFILTPINLVAPTREKSGHHGGVDATGHRDGHPAAAALGRLPQAGLSWQALPPPRTLHPFPTSSAHGSPRPRSGSRPAPGLRAGPVRGRPRISYRYRKRPGGRFQASVRTPEGQTARPSPSRRSSDCAPPDLRRSAVDLSEHLRDDARHLASPIAAARGPRNAARTSATRIRSRDLAT